MRLRAHFLLIALICAALTEGDAQVPWEEKCTEKIECERPLEMMDQRDLGTIASKKDIDRLCPNMKHGITCLHQYTKLCMGRNRQAIFNILYNGTIIFINELCHNESYQQDFLRHAPCLNGVKGDVETCEANYKFALEDIERNEEMTQEEQNLRSICCSFQEYLRCSDRTISSTCGPEARTFHKKMIDTMADALIKEQCSRYPVNSEECRAISMASVTLGSSCVLRPPYPLVVSGLLLVLGLLHGAQRT